jgi:predicted DNA-binding protein (MmcQ/YjbR family)
VEREAFLPAPYLARIHWVAAERWDALRDTEWQAELSAAHNIVLARLPRKTLTVLAMPERERKRLIDERRRLLAAKSK